MPESLAIIVMGVSGCGKSTVGAALAALLPCPFIEGDDHHPPANVAKMAAGRALDDADRAPWLDAVGAAACAALQQPSTAVVVSCSALKPQYREALRQRLAAGAAAAARFVLLEPTEGELEARLLARQAGHFMPPSLLPSQLAALDVAAAPPDLRLGPEPDGAMAPPQALARRISRFFSLPPPQ